MSANDDDAPKVCVTLICCFVCDVCWVWLLMWWVGGFCIILGVVLAGQRGEFLWGFELAHILC